jgi:hypothetical protein
MARMNTFPAKAIASSLALALCLCLLPVASPRSGEVALIGGHESCGRWLEKRRTGQAFSMQTWALGYISGAAIWGQVGDPLGPTDADGVSYWLDNYCRARLERPLEHAFQLANALVGLRAHFFVDA